MSPAAGGASRVAKEAASDSARALGVKIERKFSVGEYDILVLSAEQSDGLATCRILIFYSPNPSRHCWL
jgi:hypothetical protein